MPSLPQQLSTPRRVGSKQHTVESLLREPLWRAMEALPDMKKTEIINLLLEPSNTKVSSTVVNTAWNRQQLPR